MSGFCGWIGGSDRVRHHGEALDKMVSGLPWPEDCRTHSFCEASAGLGICSDSVTGDWLEAPDLLVAIEGYPVWRDERLAAVARAQGHAHALACAYRDHGTALFEKLRGGFSFAVLDRAAEQALLAIDRLGTQTLCYARGEPGGLVFGSTTDSVRAHPAVTATVAPQSVFNYFYFTDRIPAPGTIYREQQKLLPGQYLFFDRGRVELKLYWRMPYIEDAGTPFDELTEGLNDRLSAAVAACTAGERLSRVGAFLSGGLDSSTVVAYLAALADGPANTFTIGFEVEGYDETPYAEITHRHFKTNHDVYYMTPKDVFQYFPKISQFYDEPFGNSSALPAYCCALRAKQAGVEVMLAGDGGDELFAGNGHYVKDAIFDHYARLPVFLRRFAIEPFLKYVPFRDRVTLFRKAAKYVRLAKMPVAHRIKSDNLYAALSPTEIFEPDFLEQIDPLQPAAFSQEIYESSVSGSKLQRMMQYDLRVTLADGDLRKVARTCALAGMRVRFPFLDDDLVELSARVPPRLLLRHGRLRDFYKRAMERVLPEETLQKPKHGFGLPYEAFTAYKPLSELLCDSMVTLKKRHYVREPFLDTLIAHTRRGDTSMFDCVIWELSALELWLDSRSRADALVQEAL